MNLLIAIGHIAGAFCVLSLFEYGMLWLSAYQSQNKQKLLLVEVSSSLGVEIDDLYKKELSPKVTDFLLERFSNEIFRNRLSDFFGSILTIWQGLGTILYIIVFAYVVLITLTDDLSNAIYAWLIIPIAIFFWLISILYSFLCWIITGRYPGQAKKVRKLLVNEYDNIQTILDQNDLHTLLELGGQYYIGMEKPKDYQKAFKLLSKAAEHDAPEAQYLLGTMYYLGNGVKQDFQQAFNLYFKAAEQGVAEAQYCVGDMYREGEGVTQDYKLAFNWLSRAAEQGHPSAQNNLGSLYLNGNGVDQDSKLAVKWFFKAAEQGKSEAQHSLGGMYYLGDGITQDYKQAFKWFSRAAEQGNPDSQYSLGRMYSLGEGIEIDYQEAYNWLFRAAEQGHSSAIQVIKEWNKQL
ncbi:tetratricopeptide repeat protein [Legionella pneumophila serogroup 1]